MRYRIFGSCVTRDAFAVSTDPRIVLERYFARSSFASAFGTGPFTGVDTRTIDSPFQRRIVSWDLTKEFARSVATGDFDRIVIDLIDERFDLLRSPAGALATRSNEFLGARTTDEQLQRVPSGSDEFLRLWSEGWRSFVDLLDRTVGRHVVVLHQAYWASSTESGAPFASHAPESVEQANAFLDRLYAVIRADLSPSQVLAPPRDAFVGADQHQWGPSPFHYPDDYYRGLLTMLAEQVEDAAALADVQVVASRGAEVRTPHSVGYRFEPRADTDRYVLDAVVERRRVSAIGATFRLVGWSSVRYVAVGYLHGGDFRRVILPHDTAAGARSVELSLDALTDGEGRSSPPDEWVDTVRFYVSGHPSPRGAALEISGLALAPV